MSSPATHSSVTALRLSSVLRGDWRELSDPGGTLVVLDEPVDFDGLAGLYQLNVLALLKRAAMLGATLCWHLTGRGLPWDIPEVCHLPAPASASSNAVVAAAWAEWHRYAGCHWRRGPGFIIIKDRRRPGGARRIELDEDEEIASLVRCDTPCSKSDIAKPVLEAFRDAGLLVESRTHVLAWPVHLDRFPIPSGMVWG